MAKRKERERRARTELILREARRLLLERGYLGLTMDRIAAATEYSKGTIYQHFPNKEEVIVTLAIQTAETRIALFERAATFSGRTRERMAAIGVAATLFVQLYPDHFRSEQIVAASSVRDKVSEERQERLRACEHRCLSIVSGITRDAIAAGDLAVPAGVRPEDLSFGLWSMSYGAFLLTATGLVAEAQLGLTDPYRSLSANQQLLLDGYGWRPLSGEWDYPAARERVLSEVFAAEAARLSEEVRA